MYCPPNNNIYGMETDENAMMASAKILELIDTVYNTPTPYFEYLINDLDALPFIANTRMYFENSI